MFINESTWRVSTMRLLRPQFSMRKMSETAERLYQAARANGLLDRAMEQSSLARLLNVAPQNVNNWERRGVSKDAAIEAQKTLGVSATWVLYGLEPMMVGGDPFRGGGDPKWPFTRIGPDRYFSASPALRAAIEESVERQLSAFDDDQGGTKSSPESPATRVG